MSWICCEYDGHRTVETSCIRIWITMLFVGLPKVCIWYHGYITLSVLYPAYCDVTCSSIRHYLAEDHAIVSGRAISTSMLARGPCSCSDVSPRPHPRLAQSQSSSPHPHYLVYQLLNCFLPLPRWLLLDGISYGYPARDQDASLPGDNWSNRRLQV